MSIPTGHNAANLLRTDVFTTLLEHVPSLRLVILSPLVRDAAFVADFRQPGVLFEPLSAYRPTAIERLADSLASERFLLSSGLSAARLQRDRARLLRNVRVNSPTFTAKTWFCRLPVPRSAWYALAQRSTSVRPYRAAFERYMPDLLVTSSGGFILSEIPVIHEARRRGVPQMAVDLGWDNLSSKYHTPYPMDRLVVWNQPMYQEAVRYHGYTSDRVEVSGAPQFDHYFRREPPPRAEFLSAIGADPARKLVTVATAGAGTYSHTGRIIQTLSRAVGEGRFPMPVQVLVRFHPRDRLDLYQSLEKLPGVTIDRRPVPMQVPEGVPEEDALCPTVEDRIHLAATLAHSDVLINFASTTTIEACIFDTPIINIGFDGEQRLPLPLSIRRYFHYEHYQPILRAQAVSIADSLDGLITSVQACLERPWERQEGRQAVVSALCGYTDGRSGQRVAHAVLSHLWNQAEPARATAMAR